MPQERQKIKIFGNSLLLIQEYVQFLKIFRVQNVVL